MSGLLAAQGKGRGMQAGAAPPPPVGHAQGRALQAAAG